MEAIDIEHLVTGLKVLGKVAQVTVPKVYNRSDGEVYEVNVRFKQYKEWTMDKMYSQVEAMLVAKGLLRKSQQPKRTMWR